MADIYLKPIPQDSSSTPSSAGVSEKKAPPTYSSHPGHHSRFTAFAMHPQGVRFETKEDGEKVILLLRQHPIVNVPWILMVVAMLFLPPIVDQLGILASLPRGFSLVINLTWYLLTIVTALEKFLGWFFNVYIVTNLRVIDIDFVNLIYKNVSDANIDKIQDVSYNMGGVIRTIFNFGNVLVQTAAEIPEFEFGAVPNPAQVAKVIQELMLIEEEKNHHRP